MKFLQNGMGAILSPFDSFLALRGVKTLHIRMERHASNAMAVAKFLENHPKIEKVTYPGLPSHPQHEIAKKQMTGYGGMITIYLKGFFFIFFLFFFFYIFFIFKKKRRNQRIQNLFGKFKNFCSCRIPWWC